ncbi:hypothetical protein [Streptomyces sp. NPDC002088]|uniref:hypothetical protein n=1 Tax=Streptomyces sp. NPDC002088 TaxID=3154665 RepID=UPI003331AC12
MDASTPAVARHRLLDLAEHWNNHAMSTEDDTSAGAFNVWGNSFAREFLPAPSERVTVGGVPFVFPAGAERGDNIRCAGQYLGVPHGEYDWIHLLAAGERRVEDEVALHFADGQVDFEAVRVSDFWAAPAVFGEREAFRTPVMHYPHHVQQGVPALLWAQRIPVTRRAPLTAVRLPDHVALHVFAVTLEQIGRGEPR